MKIRVCTLRNILGNLAEGNSFLCPLITTLWPLSHFLINCKGTFPADKYTLLSESNLCSQDAVNVRVESRCSVWGRLAAEHSHLSTDTSLSHPGGGHRARSSQGGEGHPQGIPTTWVSSPCSLSTVEEFPSLANSSPPTRPPLPASLLLREPGSCRVIGPC